MTQETTVFVTHHRSYVSDATKAVIIKDLELNPTMSYTEASLKYGFKSLTIGKWYRLVKGVRRPNLAKKSTTCNTDRTIELAEYVPEPTAHIKLIKHIGVLIKLKKEFTIKYTKNTIQVWQVVIQETLLKAGIKSKYTIFQAGVETKTLWSSTEL